jgi:hypothetical protein
MHRPSRCIGMLLGAAALCTIGAPTVAHADMVAEWNDQASTSIVAVAGQPPPVSVLSFAMIQGAVYDAVNAIDRGHRPYLAQPPASPTDSKDAAAATAAFRVLIALFPAQQPTLQTHYEASLAAVPDIPPGAKAGGVSAGEEAARAMLVARADDGRFGPFTPVIGTTPGTWRPTAPLFAQDPAPWVGNVRPFLVPSAEQLRSEGPNALTSRAYARDFKEVKEVGSLNSKTRTPDQTDAAIYWQEPAFTHWNRVFRTLAANQSLNIVDSARLFAMENLAAADAAIGCWNDKYHWNFWRPITAIHEAASDGNRATGADPNWTPLFDPSTPVSTPPALVTPPFPDHPSGHTCAAGAIVGTLQNFFGTDRIGFSATSNKTGTTRTYDRFSDALRENINARVWAGIHFRTADTQGARLGAKVARYLRKHYFQPAH